MSLDFFAEVCMFAPCSSEYPLVDLNLSKMLVGGLAKGGCLHG